MTLFITAWSKKQRRVVQILLWQQFPAGITESSQQGHTKAQIGRRSSASPKHIAQYSTGLCLGSKRVIVTFFFLRKLCNGKMLIQDIC